MAYIQKSRHLTSYDRDEYWYALQPNIEDIYNIHLRIYSGINFALCSAMAGQCKTVGLELTIALQYYGRKNYNCGGS